MKLAVIVGSLRAGSYNKVLARVVCDRLPEGTEVAWVDVSDIPFMNEDLETAVPGSVLRAAEQVASADGVLIVSPEYNRGLPAVTKNIIDWLSRPSTGDPFKYKPVAIGGISTGPIRTQVMQSQLRPVLAHVGAPVMAGPALALTLGADNMTAEGVLSAATAQHIDAYVEALVRHVQLYSEVI